MQRITMSRLVASLASLALLAACADGTGIGERQSVSLSVSTAGSSSTDGSSVGGGLGLVIGGEDGPLVITRAQIVLREIDLESPDFVCGAGDDSVRHGDGDDCEIELGPTLVDLPLGGELASVVSVDVPEGLYDEIEFELHKPDDDTQADIEFLAAHPSFRRVSLRVEGTFEGEPFVFTSDVNEDLELDFGSPLVVDATGVNITVDIGLAAWFQAPGGGVLRPSDANADLIETNIRGSFRAFEDDDRDGHDDHS